MSVKRIKNLFQAFYLISMCLCIFFTLSTIPLVRCLSQLGMALSCFGILPYCNLRLKSGRMEMYGFILFGVVGLIGAFVTLLQIVI